MKPSLLPARLVTAHGEVTRPPRPARPSRPGTHPSARLATRAKSFVFITWGLLALVVACAPVAASREPAEYPALPASATPSGPRFEPAPELAASAPNCRDAEPSLDNALDDDCDGRVDGADPAAPLWLALAYPRASALQLSWRESGQTHAPISQPPCAEDAPFCTVRLGAETFPRGTHTLLVQATDMGAAALPSSLLVSVQAQGKASAYLLRIERTGEPRAVGRLINP